MRGLSSGEAALSLLKLGPSPHAADVEGLVAGSNSAWGLDPFVGSGLPPNKDCKNGHYGSIAHGTKNQFSPKGNRESVMLHLVHLKPHQQFLLNAPS